MKLKKTVVSELCGYHTLKVFLKLERFHWCMPFSFRALSFLFVCIQISLHFTYIVRTVCVVMPMRERERDIFDLPHLLVHPSFVPSSTVSLSHDLSSDSALVSQCLCISLAFL